MKVWRVDITLEATLYIKADDEAAANDKARVFFLNGSIELPSDRRSEVELTPVSSRLFADPALPELSLSPAMTVTSISGAEDVDL